MCDEQTVKDDNEYLRKQGLTRREFSKQSAGVAAAIMLPAVANAMDVSEQDVIVETPDGQADCYFVHPDSGQHAGGPVVSTALDLRLHSGLVAAQEGRR